MNEFELIDAILAELGEAAVGAVVGPGDDACAITVPADELLVSSIDALIEGVHFPHHASGEQVGYRAAMVSLSDLAAMGAVPAQLLVGLTLGSADQAWALGVARGLAEAALAVGCPVLGGNLARGHRAATISVHGFCPPSGLLRRTGGRAGERLFVTGTLGAAAAAVMQDRLRSSADPLSERYFRPSARIAAGQRLRGAASACIDVSDGLLQDLGHLCKASGVGADLDSVAIPVHQDASLDQALHGGDDYELLFAAPAGLIPELGVPVSCIGTLSSEPGVRLDGEPIAPRGYQHFD